MARRTLLAAAGLLTAGALGSGAYALTGPDVPRGTTVAGVDVSGTSSQARAALEALPVPRSVALVADGERLALDPAAAGLRVDVEATLEQAAAVVREAGVDVETFARQGDPADAILDVAEERGSDLIVIGNKGMTGAKRFLLGSVPNKVSHHAPCSVLIIRTV